MITRDMLVAWERDLRRAIRRPEEGELVHDVANGIEVAIIDMDRDAARRCTCAPGGGAYDMMPDCPQHGETK